MLTILVTGGAGYIGSHTVLELIAAGHDVIIYDNLSNSSALAVEALSKLSGRDIVFLNADLRDYQALEGAFATYDIDAVVHFAALKAVGESVEQPGSYYHNNLLGTIQLCQAMQEHNVRTLIHSSSATVYGAPESLPLSETHPINSSSASNPYGRIKIMIEEMLQDMAYADPTWRIALLRYFNPIGAHPSGCIGEDPNGIPNNLLPFITQVAVGRREMLSVYGDDYPTPDGTCIRDYVHVCDLARGHVMALDYLTHQPQGLIEAINLGTGKGSSVLDIIHAFEEATGIAIPYRVAERRAGDLPELYADPSKAERLMGWKAENDLATMCRDAWRWQKNNPQGFANSR